MYILGLRVSVLKFSPQFRNSNHLHRRAFVTSKTILCKQIPIQTKIISSAEFMASYKYETTTEYIQQFEHFPAVNHCSVKSDLSIWEWTYNPAAPNQQYVQDFVHLANYCHESKAPISSEIFDSFIDSFVCRLSDFNENELLVTLQVFARLPLNSIRFDTRNYRELFMAFDDNCCRLGQRWDTDQLLTVFSIWTVIPFAKKAKFCKLFTRRTERHLKYLTSKQFVPSFFFMNCTQRFLSKGFTQFENHFKRIIDDLTVCEIATLCYTFNREKYRIHDSDLIDKITDRFIQSEIGQMGEKQLKEIIKTIQLSSRRNSENKFDSIFKVLRGQLNRLSVSMCIQLLHVADAVFLHDPPTVENVLERAPAAIEQLSIEDMADICHFLVKYDYKSPEQLETKLLPIILKEIRNRVFQIKYSPLSLHSLLFYLAVLGYHDNEIISNALREDFLTAAYGNRLLDNCVYGLNAYVQINLKGVHDGNTLPKKYVKTRHNIIKLNMKLKDNLKSFGRPRVSRQLMGFLDELAIPFQLGYALSHYEVADLFVVIDKPTGMPTLLNNKFPDIRSGCHVSKSDFIGEDDDANVEVIAIVATYWDDYCKLKKTPNGLLKLKLEQLKLLGYHACHSDFCSWYNLSEDERRDFIQMHLSRMCKDITEKM